MKLKKIASLAFAGIMAVSMLAGCATTSNEPEQPNQPEEPSTTNYAALLQEDLEDEKITDVDFVELSACAGGCVGGILTVENPFLARTRLQKIQGHLSPEAQPPEVTDERLMLFDHPIKFCEVLSLARDLTTAMELLARVDEIEQDLYGMDCGACGAPSCRALATDIALGRAAVEDCIYIQRERHTAKP